MANEHDTTDGARAPSAGGIVYVAREIERAFGMDPSPSYRIVANRSAYAETIKSLFPAYVTLVDGPLDTVELLALDAATPLPGESVLVFKNTPAIEELCAKRGWRLLNPSAALAERIENKVTQVEFLGEAGEKHFPPHSIGPLKGLSWASGPEGIANKPRILQWAHGHTGDGTILISSEAELAALQKKFPERPARQTALVRGHSFTLNVIVSIDGAIQIGNISYQITGLAPFTDGAFATVGNDWSAAHTMLSETDIEAVHAIARDVGAAMAKSGWRGLFGIDVMKDSELDKIFLIEINARQPASTAFESRLQESYRRHGVRGSTVFEAHLDALVDASNQSASSASGAATEDSIVEINDGAQIVQRVTAATKAVSDDARGSLELAGYMTISYENTAPGSDLIRIQSPQGIIDALGNLNARGTEIADILSGKDA